jgi:hypothetical protein
LTVILGLAPQAIAWRRFAALRELDDSSQLPGVVVADIHHRLQRPSAGSLDEKTNMSRSDDFDRPDDLDPVDDFDSPDDFDDSDDFDDPDDSDDSDDFDRGEDFDRSGDFGGSHASPAGMSGCGKIALGCGVIVLLLAIGAGIVGLWVVNNARELGADLAGTLMKEGLKEFQLPDDQRKRIFDRIDEVSTRFKDGEITIEEVRVIFENIAESPLMPAGMALVVNRVYLRDSGLDEDERAAARVAIQRFTHGTINESIPEAEVNKVLDTIRTKDRPGNRQFRHPLTDDELRKFVEAAAQAADDASVPAEVPEVNFADEFDKVIDEALGLSTKAPQSSPTAD